MHCCVQELRIARLRPPLHAASRRSPHLHSHAPLLCKQPALPPFCGQWGGSLTADVRVAVPPALGVAVGAVGTPFAFPCLFSSAGSVPDGTGGRRTGLRLERQVAALDMYGLCAYLCQRSCACRDRARLLPWKPPEARSARLLPRHRIPPLSSCPPAPPPLPCALQTTCPDQPTRRCQEDDPDQSIRGKTPRRSYKENP